MPTVKTRNPTPKADGGPINPDGLISIVCNGVVVGKIREWVPATDRPTARVYELKSPVIDLVNGPLSGVAGTISKMIFYPDNM